MPLLWPLILFAIAGGVAVIVASSTTSTGGWSCRRLERPGRRVLPPNGMVSSAPQFGAALSVGGSAGLPPPSPA